MTGLPAGDAAAALAALPGPDDPVLSRMVIVGCSRRKRLTAGPVAALDLYEGSCVPQLRDRLGPHPRLRGRLRILSARHGLVGADTPLRAYDQPLDPETAAGLRPSVAATLIAEFTSTGVPGQVLVIAEPLYLVLIADLLTAGIRMWWVPDIRDGWAEASAVLDEWRWP